MSLGHPLPSTVYLHMPINSTIKSATKYRSLLRKMTCNLRHPMGLGHPVPSTVYLYMPMNTSTVYLYMPMNIAYTLVFLLPYMPINLNKLPGMEGRDVGRQDEPTDCRNAE